MSFSQPDKKNTFTELTTLFQGEIHEGAMVVGLLSIALLVLWDRSKPLKISFLPGPLAVVLLGVAFTFLFRSVGGDWLIGPKHLVLIPTPEPGQSNVSSFLSSLTMADFSQWRNSQVYVAAFTIAIVASLETLLNAEAVDRLVRCSGRRRPVGSSLRRELEILWQGSSVPPRLRRSSSEARSMWLRERSRKSPPFSTACC
jgi:carbonic anhydrase